jgi:Na+/H+ antiporter NhaC
VKQLPASYVVILIALLVVATFATLVYLGIPPFDNASTFIVFSAAGVITLLIVGVVGGAFVGMLLAHRILGNREFSPFERDVLRSLQDMRDRLDEIESGREKRASEEEPVRR